MKSEGIENMRRGSKFTEENAGELVANVSQLVSISIVTVSSQEFAIN